MKIEAYLNFDGRTEEAIEFYRKALGAEVLMMLRMKDNPAPEMVAPGTEDKIMHVSLRIGESTVMASDCHCTGKPGFQGISLSLSVADAAAANRAFNALSEGGQVQMPLGETFFSPSFGVVTDRFGVSWMIIVPQAM